MGVFRRVVTLVISPHMRYGIKMRQLFFVGRGWVVAAAARDEPRLLGVAVLGA